MGASITHVLVVLLVFPRFSDSSAGGDDRLCSGEGFSEEDCNARGWCKFDLDQGECRNDVETTCRADGMCPINTAQPCCSGASHVGPHGTHDTGGAICHGLICGHGTRLNPRIISHTRMDVMHANLMKMEHKSDFDEKHGGE